MARITPQGHPIDAELVRAFLRAALEHDAVRDDLDDLIFEHVVEGKYHPSVITASLKRSITDVVNAAKPEDWRAISEQLVEDARAAL